MISFLAEALCRVQAGMAGGNMPPCKEVQQSHPRVIS
jgi:hypothetical protein